VWPARRQALRPRETAAAVVPVERSKTNYATLTGVTGLGS